MNINYLI